MTDPRDRPVEPPDPFLEYDAAYVLGALSPEERQSFQQHLKNCVACTARVSELADLPGLLSRSDPQSADEPPPDLLLPQLLSTARTERRRRRLLSAGGWLVAAACAVTLVLVLAFGSNTPAGSTNASPAVVMEPVGDTAMTANVSLTGVSWGTKIELQCSYDDGYDTDGAYLLVVYGPDGQRHPVGSWKVLPGRTYTIAASTDISATDITRVEVQTLNEVPVLEANP